MTHGLHLLQHRMAIEVHLWKYLKELHLTPLLYMPGLTQLMLLELHTHQRTHRTNFLTRLIRSNEWPPSHQRHRVIGRLLTTLSRLQICLSKGFKKGRTDCYARLLRCTVGAWEFKLNECPREVSTHFEVTSAIFIVFYCMSPDCCYSSSQWMIKQIQWAMYTIWVLYVVPYKHVYMQACDKWFIDLAVGRCRVDISPTARSTIHIYPTIAKLIICATRIGFLLKAI